MINRVRKSFALAEECKHGGKVQEASGDVWEQSRWTFLPISIHWARRL